MNIACGGFSFFRGGEYLTYAVRCAKIFRKYCLELERAKMERIKTLETRNLCESAENRKDAAFLGGTFHVTGKGKTLYGSSV